MSSIIIGIEGQVLSAADRQRLCTAHCAGVIVFARNYESPEQLRALTQSIRALKPEALISVDHEGGRVQRFVRGFTPIPAMAQIGVLFAERPLLAYQLARACGVMIAYELAAMDVDFSFTPVLDLRDARSSVIGDRAFAADPAAVSLLASALRRGLAQGGMAAVGKHYPGHGRVCGDSHHLLPHDERTADEREADILPFLSQIDDGIEALMPAHIVYPESAGMPAGFSPQMLQCLRDLGFDGAIISDDLDMAGAQIVADAALRVQTAFDAGADLALMANDFTAMDAALRATYTHSSNSPARIAALRRRPPSSTLDQQYAQAKTLFNAHHPLLFPSEELN